MSNHDILTRLAKLLELLLIMCLLLIVFCRDIDSVSFHRDESQWIATSNFFEVFARGKFTASMWNENYWTLTQPPVTRYVIGLGRRIGGHRPEDLNLPWDFRLDDTTNIALGAMPSSGLLWWSRLPMAILSAVSGLILFSLVSKSAGRIAGYTLLLLFVGNPYLLTTLRRAMGEAPLLVFVTLAAFASDQALIFWQRVASAPYKSFRPLLHSLIWFIFLGILAGIAGASKLNGIITAAAGLALSILAPLTHQGAIPKSARLTFAILIPVILLLATATTFVALNPYLYPDPLGNTAKLFNFRVREMQDQQAANSEAVIHGTRMRIEVVSQRVFQNYATIRFAGAWGINLLLCVVGAYSLTGTAWRWVRGDRDLGTSVVIILVALTTSTPALFTPLDWDRYYLLPIVFSSICIAIGISGSITVSIKWARCKIFEDDVMEGTTDAQS